DATIADTAALEIALVGLPLCLLEQPKDVIRTLGLMGVHTLGECLALPRDGLARRFGQALRDELDRALGRLPDPRAPWVAPSRYKAQLALPAPVRETEPLLFAANRLIREVPVSVRMKRAGVRRPRPPLRQEPPRPTFVILGFGVPSRAPRRILMLLRERLATVTLPERVEAITLESAETRPLGS